MIFSTCFNENTLDKNQMRSGISLTRIINMARKVRSRRFTVSGFLPALLAVVLIQLSAVHAAHSGQGVILADDKGEVLYARNPDIQLIPASVLKIITALAAFHTLGETYTFKTGYFWDRLSNNLYLKGYGDPLFISEVIQQFAGTLSTELDTRQLNTIVIDQTYFAPNIVIPGRGASLNPYDATLGALCANFNTLHFQWDPEKRQYISAEPQTPLLPIFSDQIKQANMTQGRIPIPHQQADIYPGLLLQYFLEKKGLKVKNGVRTGRLQNENLKFNTFHSPFTITDVVKKLLKYSNNFMANQLLLTLGASLYGPPATLDKGTRAVDQFLQHYFDFKDIKIHEGSGLSRSNKISPNQMLAILLRFMPYHTLLNRKKTEFYKTGTLHNIRTRAGFLSGKNNRLYPYVILLNGTSQGMRNILSRLIDKVSELDGTGS